MDGAFAFVFKHLKHLPLKVKSSCTPLESVTFTHNCNRACAQHPQAGALITNTTKAKKQNYEDFLTNDYSNKINLLLFSFKINVTAKLC